MHVFAPFFCAGACSTTCSHPHTSLNITILWSEDNQSRHSAFSFAFLLQVTPICKCLCFLSWNYWILLDIPLCDSLLLSDMVTMGRIIPYISTILLFLLIFSFFFFPIVSLPHWHFRNPTTRPTSIHHLLCSWHWVPVLGLLDCVLFFILLEL